MIALENVDMTLDASYQRPAIMRGAEAVSAFDPDPPKTQRPVALIRTDEDAVTPLVTTLLSQGVVVHFGPRAELRSELTEKVRQARVVQQEYRRRVETLRSEVALDSFWINEGSEKDFWAFMKLQPFVKKGLLAAVDNGNLRAVWKGEHGTHIGLQFLGNRKVQYVIFKRRTPGGEISRVAGYDTLDGVKRQIHAFNLEPLLYA